MMVYIFLVFTFFILLNTFDVRYIKNLSDLKKFGVIFPFNLLFLVTILSFAGIPPLFGFSIKLISFLLIINSSAFFYLIFLSIFNFFTLYFYIQNVRYVINNSSNNFYIYINNVVFISDITMFFSILFLLINTAGILYLSDLLILFTNLSV
jgi:NADH:ubiquinone oxidoreductase subunit 2 (subunit N)